MSVLDPGNTTLGDLIAQALKECGFLGVGQTALAEDTQDAWARLQWILQQWERKRWIVYHLVTYLKTSTGAQFYTVGPGGDIDTGVSSARPARLESAFLRQLTQSQPNQIDYSLDVLQSMEDYNRIAIKQLVAFPGYAFYDSAWPLGKLYLWPVPQASIYAAAITVMEQLPVKFASLATVFNIPYEYYRAMLTELALALRPKYGIASPPGDLLVAQNRDAMNVLRNANTQISRLQIPPELTRPGIYNIWSDRSY